MKHGQLLKPEPVYLARELNPGNIAKAIHTVRPFGIDVCSGLRVDDKLNTEKVKSFFEKIDGLSPSP